MNNVGYIVSGIVAGFGTALVLNEHAVSRLYESGYADSENRKTYFAPGFGNILVEIQPYMHLSKIAKTVNGLSLVCLGALTGALIQVSFTVIVSSLFTGSYDLSQFLSHAKIGAIAGLISGLFTEPKIKNESIRLFISLV